MRPENMFALDHDRDQCSVQHIVSKDRLYWRYTLDVHHVPVPWLEDGRPARPRRREMADLAQSYFFVFVDSLFI